MLKSWQEQVRAGGWKSGLGVIAMAVMMTACGGGGGEAPPAGPVNQAPVASNVVFSDGNGGDLLAGDIVTGSYDYFDQEGDAEATSTFRWLRNGVPILGATMASYTLSIGDIVASIQFEVTPVAASGNTHGIAVLSTPVVTGTAPVVKGPARYYDVDMDGYMDDDDEIVVAFDQDIQISNTIAFDSAFQLPVTGDSFGDSPTLLPGPLPNEITIRLSNPGLIMDLFKARHDFDPNNLQSNAASGIDISASMAEDTIENLFGIDASPSLAVDIFAGLVLSPQTISNTEVTYGALTGDINHDGDLDMVKLNIDSVSIYTNSNGTFSDSGQSINTGYRKGGIALGDVDNDGDVDIVIANAISNPNFVFLNDGGGTYTDSGQSLGNGSSTSVTLGDVDQDGDLDMFVGNEGPNKLYLNDGLGGFSDSGMVFDDIRTVAVAFGDIDKDSDLDLVEANYTDGNDNKIYINDGSGGFVLSNQYIGSRYPRDIELGDIDNDGDLDILIARVAFDSEIYLNDSSGNFSLASQLWNARDVDKLTLTDIDDDGDLDILMALDDRDDASHLYLNDGAGLFSESGQAFYNSPDRIADIIAGDFDNDGDQDLIEISRGESNRLYINSLSTSRGNLNFVDSGQAVGMNNSYSSTVGDIDADGDVDLVVVNANQGNRVYLNDGSGVFSDSNQSLGNHNSYASALGDIDKDGDLDWVVGNLNGQANRVYLNDGAGNFSNSSQLIGSGSSRSVQLGDIDRDGDLDLVVANYGQANMIYFNDGSGGFSDSGQRLGSNNSTSLALSDIDRDGDLDIAVANYAQANRVYYNDGNGDFATFIDSPQTDNSEFILTANFKNGGEQQIAVANYGQGNGIYLYNTIVQFHESQTIGNASSSAMDYADVDGDGDLDIAVSNTSGETNQLYLNNGTGIFSSIIEFAGVDAGNSYHIILEDIDRDGDPDAIITNHDEANKVYINN